LNTRNPWNTQRRQKCPEQETNKLCHKGVFPPLKKHNNTSTNATTPLLAPKSQYNPAKKKHNNFVE
jgi:hypothetical protein